MKKTSTILILLSILSMFVAPVIADDKQGSTDDQVIQGAYDCRLSVSPETISVGPGSGTTKISITSRRFPGVDCDWNVTDNTSWLSFNSGNSGSGEGYVWVTYSENDFSEERTGTITVAGESASPATIPVSQAGAGPEIIYPIGLNSSTKDPDPWDGSDGMFDWYSVQVIEPGTISVTQTRDGLLGLYTDTFNLLKKDNTMGQISYPYVSMFLEPGRYYIKCQDSSGMSTYTLHVTFRDALSAIVPSVNLLLKK